ncbi:FAD-dependent oxidoreductase [Nocardioides immobilis]|uniref:FAD-dependent oxidoreductase n=1 Tax=Nocardioides immobilis TaxID=2049295 RepID=A0A417XZC8_9ACTN|nr:FAD-dependent oxidoreductase [Nocardioides immobilis]RHW25704.1 FAD-dependent oxidoreductase [Nocardioides immobilis]
MAIEKFVVVGASLAGLRAVEAARKAGFQGEITLIGAESHLPYDRPPLSKEFLEPADGQPDPPYFREESVFADELGVTLMLGRPATELDVEARVVRVGTDQVPYDALVIATGAAARHIPGAESLAGVQVLRTLDDSLAVRNALDEGARTVVIGAGFIGSEIASSANKRGVEVTIVEALPTPLVRATGTEMGPAIASLHERNGTSLRCGVGVRSIEGLDRVEKVVLEDGTEIPADLVVIGIGVTPSVGWLEGSGLRLDNGIHCDETLWTGVPGVYAAGDVVSWPNPTLGVRQRMENWTAAAEQGAAAARNALDPGNAKAYGTVPYFWSDWYDVRIQHVGTPDADEVVLVEGDLERAPATDNRWIALYRKGDRLVGALTVQGQAEIMKYRVQIMKGASWEDALAHAARRREAHAAKLAAV